MPIELGKWYGRRTKKVSIDDEGAGAGPDYQPLDRFNAFSDGVFAIAITLLVLDLPGPPVTAPVLPAFAESWQDFLGYAISFAFVGGGYGFPMPDSRNT